MITSKIIADSLNESGDRCTSFVCTFPRYILAEVNTHRALSRNSASSRAIPFEKMLQLVRENPFVPIMWMKDHKGMQGTEFYTEQEVKDRGLIESWLEARDEAVLVAYTLNDKDVTKQMVNRLLEPFMWHTAIITATDWDNFYSLRANAAADIHFETLANQMLNCMNLSTPVQLHSGEWHCPFGDSFDKERIAKMVDIDIDTRIKIATARCARVSYNNFEGKDDYEADVKLYNTLLEAGHMSPFEHCAKASTSKSFGNFTGFIQLRKTIQGENRTDLRLKKYK